MVEPVRFHDDVTGIVGEEGTGRENLGSRRFKGKVRNPRVSRQVRGGVESERSRSKRSPYNRGSV